MLHATICIGGQIERAWAYLTIKKLLDKAKYDAVSSSEAQKLKDEALELSLKVSLATFRYSLR